MRSDVNIQSEIRNYLLKVEIMNDKRRYPLFEKDKKGKIMGNFGWGVDNLRFKSVNQETSIDRTHLKYFDTTKPSRFCGHPAGFNENVPEKPLIDMDPAIYRNLNPPDRSYGPLHL